MNYSLNKRRRLALILTPVATAFVLVGCSSGNDVDSAADSSTPAPAPSSPAVDGGGQSAMTPQQNDSSDGDKDSSNKSDSQSQKEPAGYISYADYSSNEAKYSGDDVVLFFNASWCSTCVEADKQLSGAQFPDDLVVVSVDYDANQDLRQQYGVTTQHTFVQIDSDGSEVTKFTGSKTVDDISEQLA
ncbi:MAG: hypothetical protein CMH41_00020 [Micrococcales bacterium]|nr:hypothetical protein [Micrococcales bacterium]